MIFFRTSTTTILLFFFFQAEDGIRDVAVTGVQTCALPISGAASAGTEGGEIDGIGALPSAETLAFACLMKGLDGYSCINHRYNLRARSRSSGWLTR